MSIVVHEPAAAGGGARISCFGCDAAFDVMKDHGEAAYFAGVHNDLVHGGQDEAAVFLPGDRSEVSDLVDDDADEL